MDELRIGLIGHRGDPQLARLFHELQARQAVPVPFDLTDIPAHVAFHWAGDSLRLGSIELGELATIYARTALFPMPTFVPGRRPEEGEQLTFPVREVGSVLNAIIAELAARVPLVNPPATLVFHGQKPFMYRVLQRAGVAVPEFVVGCDLAAAARFVDRHDQQVVVKPLMGGEVAVADLAWLKAHAAEVDRRPLLLQRRILGRSLRAYVVAGQLVATAEMVHGDCADWRCDLRDIRPVEPTAEERAAACRAALALGLHFAAVDLEQEPAGPGSGSASGAAPEADHRSTGGWRTWVIDVNPAPMFANFEARARLDVAGPLAAHLVQMAREGRESGT